MFRRSWVRSWQGVRQKNKELNHIEKDILIIVYKNVEFVMNLIQNINVQNVELDSII